MKKLLVATVLTALTSTTAIAATPVMFSSINNFNAPDENNVAGVRLTALYGKVEQVKGLDLAVLGMSETDKISGVHLSLLGASKVNQDMTGASFGIFNWNEGQTTGANLGLVNVTNNVTGANISLVNVSQGDTSVDVGAANISEASTVQVGIFNKTAHIKGVQIGLLNCADNGFLKCFPIFNFAK